MIGTTLGHYQITSLLGKGGMGEVYRAKDQKLGRDVAIKVLPEEFARDTDRVARFQREAKLLASLNHPNIAAIYGLEESGKTNFLVLELVEGKTLADHIAGSAVVLAGNKAAETAALPGILNIALQIAEALEAAHEKGVIHRDLKPANIKVTPEGKVKVLDFGLAKAFAGEQENRNLSNSPTLSDAATLQGVILGTAAYMSPEQARGKPVDKRADIWAFGVVLFEMLTGKSLFGGDDVSQTLARVLERQPDFSALPENLHPRVRSMLERCLEKAARNRYGSISDARVDIEKALADPGGVSGTPIGGVKPRAKMRTVFPWVAAALVLGAVIAGIAIWRLKPAPAPEPKRVMRFTYELPANQQFRSGTMAVSPDGSKFVYGTNEGLHVRTVDQLGARFIAGTDKYSSAPEFSPDGQWICYWSANDRKLKKITVSGGVPVVLCDTGLNIGGEHWYAEDAIVYSDYLNGGIKRISAGGGTPETLVKADLAKLSESGVPVAPQVLPDGKNLLFTDMPLSTAPVNGQIVLQSLESGERKVLLKGASHGFYIPTGHIVYSIIKENARDLIAVPFDLEKLQVAGGPVPLLESIARWAVGPSGTLIYVSRPTSASASAEKAEPAPSSGRRLVWVDRQGHETPIKTPPYNYQYPRISPDGKKVALTISTGGNQDIRIWDFVRETLTRLTFDKAADLTPLWTPDGRRIVFSSYREPVPSKGGVSGIFWKAADGTGEEEFLGSAKGRMIFPYGWSKDGKYLVVSEWDTTATTNTLEAHDIGVFSMEGNHPRKLLLQEKFMETLPRISPDGRWMAYMSDESGENEIYVRPFPEVNKGRWQISTNGGDSVLWSPDGRELFYLSEDFKAVMAVAVSTEQAFSVEKPRLLFRGDYVNDVGVTWDVSPDGRRFLMMKEPVATGASTADAPAAELPRKIEIVLNWFEELKQRVPVK